LSTNQLDNTTKTKTTTTISHTYINTMDSNYSYRDSNRTPPARSPVNQQLSSPPTPPPPSSTSYYQTLSNINRNIPIRDETNRHSSSWENAAREYQLRDNTIQDDSSRDTTNRNSSVHDSRSTSPESLVQDNTEDENHQNLEYETLLDG
jgi:hypothetical protein